LIGFLIFIGVSCELILWANIFQDFFIDCLQLLFQLDVASKCGWDLLKKKVAATSNGGHTADCVNDLSLTRNYLK
jgi:hypothetical protein